MCRGRPRLPVQITRRDASDTRLNKSRLIRFQLQLIASILLTSVCAAGWPYREVVGVEQSATPVFVAPVYGLAPALSILEPAEEVATVVAGPVTGTTVVKGSSSGPVTYLSPEHANAVLQNDSLLITSNLSFYPNTGLQTRIYQNISSLSHEKLNYMWNSEIEQKTIID